MAASALISQKISLIDAKSKTVAKLSALHWNYAIDIESES